MVQYLRRLEMDLPKRQSAATESHYQFVCDPSRRRK